MTPPDLETVLRDRPDKVKINTAPEFDEIGRLAKEGRFRIHSVEIGLPGQKWRWRFELIWPNEAEINRTDTNTNGNNDLPLRQATTWDQATLL